MTKTDTFITVAGLNKVLRAIPKEAAGELRDASQHIAGWVADEAGDAMRSQPGIARAVAPTIKAGRDRVPVVKMGGTKRLPPHSDGRARASLPSQTVGAVWAGVEFGSNRYTQFRRHLGQTGYALYPTIRANGDRIMREYGDALGRAVRSA